MRIQFFLRGIGQYFYRVGVIGHYTAILILLVSMFAGVVVFIKYDLPTTIFFQRATNYLENSTSPLLKKLSYGTRFIAKKLEESSQESAYQLKYNRDLVGASFKNSIFQKRTTENNTELNNHYQRMLNFPISKLRTVRVNSTLELLKAIAQARAGDDIVISAGHYKITQRQIYLSKQGTPNRPIRLRAENFSDVTINLDTYEGFVITGDYWVVENLIVNGVCIKDAKCEHAIHITGAEQLIIRNNKLTNFNSTIKANAIGKAGSRRFPDNILFEYNTVYNDTSRKTNTSVTLIDVVTGDNWIIRKNFVANHSKHGSDNISYALFLKGNGNNGLIEKNIIDCQWSLPNDDYTRVGISLGGGGTGTKYCRNGSCPAEHTGGVIENNFVVNCSQDVAIYLNKAKGSRIVHNTLINSLGLDVRFNESSAIIINNALTGRIRSRDGGKIIVNENNTVLENALLSFPTPVLSQTSSDLCDMKRFRFSLAGAFGRKCLDKMAFEVITN